MQDYLISVVDFGSKKISVSVGKEFEGDIEILGTTTVASRGIEKGFIVDEVKAVESFSAAVEKLEDKTKENITEIYAGISLRGIRLTETSISIRLNEGKVRGKDIKSALIGSAKKVNLIDGEEIVDTIINYYNIDGNIVCEDIIGWKGEILTLNLTVFIGPSNELVKYKNIINQAGYKLKGFLVNTFLGKSIFLQGKSALGVKVLVDIGAGTTDLAIFKNGIIKYIKCIPVGGNNITKDLSICGGFSIPEAENIKNIYSSNYQSLYFDESNSDLIEIGAVKTSAKLFYEVTQARLEEILEYVNNQVKNTSFCEGLCSIIMYGDGIIYYQDIDKLAKQCIQNRTVFATSDYLGMKNTAKITSLAGLKEVFDRMQLLYANSNKNEVKNEHLEKSSNHYNNQKDNVKTSSDYKEQGIIQKIKDIIRGIFKEE
jgi:cell division protein FtsA